MNIIFNRDKLIARGINKETKNKGISIFQLDRVYEGDEHITKDTALEVLEENNPLLTLEFKNIEAIDILIRHLEGLKNDI